jgi:HEAT repeat protein
MAKSRKLEELTAALHQIRDQPTSELGLETLQQILKSKQSIAIAQAAHLIGQWEIYALTAELVTAFDRLLLKAKDSDPGCRAKHAIAETLYRLNYSDESLFLKGIHHVQLEPVWGGQVDTAPRLRGTCALGLVRMNYPLVMVELADLLADPEPEARIGAARAIAYTENPQGVPLLRLRLKLGDTSPVLSEYAIALLKLAPDQSLPLVKALLHSPQQGTTENVETAEAMALALGESRLSAAFPLLRDWWQQIRDPELRKTGLLAIATLRQDTALEFLLSLIADGKPEDATGAVRAVSIYRQDLTLWQRVQSIVAQRQDQAIQHMFDASS